MIKWVASVEQKVKIILHLYYHFIRHRQQTYFCKIAWISCPKWINDRPNSFHIKIFHLYNNLKNILQFSNQRFSDQYIIFQKVHWISNLHAWDYSDTRSGKRRKASFLYLTFSKDSLTLTLFQKAVTKWKVFNVNYQESLKMVSTLLVVGNKIYSKN